jgi:pyruvate decarboxylase
MAADDAVAAAPVAASDADPTAPLSPIEMWRQIEQDLDSKTTLPVETRDCWLYGMYKELPGGARFEIEMRYCSIGWSVPASFGDAKGLD